jgi:hypothetical protein
VTKKEKLEARIRNNPKNVTLHEFESLVNIYGHIKPGSKHAKAVLGNRTLTYKRANPIATVYVDDLLKLIDLQGGL